MKKSIYLLVAMLFTLVACQQEQLDVPTEPGNIFQSQLAKMVDGKLKLTIEQGAILAAAQEIDVVQRLQLIPQEAKITEIDGKHYLRIFSSEDYISTMELIADPASPLGFVAADVICSSSDCASGGGCIPDGQYCTKCVVGQDWWGNDKYGDCDRTTISRVQGAVGIGN
ncbi:MAG: hypothetical protein AAF206_03405 [Bacteroidota bacterium]